MPLTLDKHLSHQVRGEGWHILEGGYCPQQPVAMKEVCLQKEWEGVSVNLVLSAGG